MNCLFWTYFECFWLFFIFSYCYNAFVYLFIPFMHLDFLWLLTMSGRHFHLTTLMKSLSSLLVIGFMVFTRWSYKYHLRNSLSRREHHQKLSFLSCVFPKKNWASVFGFDDEGLVTFIYNVPFFACLICFLDLILAFPGTACLLFQIVFEWIFLSNLLLTNYLLFVWMKYQLTIKRV